MSLGSVVPVTGRFGNVVDRPTSDVVLLVMRKNNRFKQSQTRINGLPERRRSKDASLLACAPQPILEPDFRPFARTRYFRKFVFTYGNVFSGTATRFSRTYTHRTKSVYWLCPTRTFLWTRVYDFPTKVYTQTLSNSYLRWPHLTKFSRCERNRRFIINNDQQT